MIFTTSGFSKTKTSLLLLFFWVALSSSCTRSKGSLREDGIFETKDTHYRIGEIPHTWKRMSLRKADLGFANPENGSVLLINSHCDKERDTPLLALSWQLLIGMTETKILDRKTIPHSQREGMETTAEARLDGVKRRLRTFVLKKNYCVYDIVFSASIEKFDEDLMVYKAALDGFEVPGESL